MKNPTKERSFRVKNPKMVFFCPLCRCERGLRYLSRLNHFQYLQIAVISISCMFLSFPLMQERMLFWPFLIWGIFEMTNKWLYRKELPCPECGFDATWYRRDVKVAKRQVINFWKKKQPS